MQCRTNEEVSDLIVRCKAIVTKLQCKGSVIRSECQKFMDRETMDRLLLLMLQAVTECELNESKSIIDSDSALSTAPTGITDAEMHKH